MMEAIIAMVRGQIASADQKTKQIARNIASRTERENFTFEDGIVWGAMNQKDKDDFDRSAEFHSMMLSQYRHGKSDGLRETLKASWDWIQSLLESEKKSSEFISKAKERFFKDNEKEINIPV